MIGRHSIQIDGGLVVHYYLPVTPKFQRFFGAPGIRQVHQGGFPGLQSPPVDPVGGVHVDSAQHVASVVRHERPTVDGQNRGPEHFQFLFERVGVYAFDLRQWKFILLVCILHNYNK